MSVSPEKQGWTRVRIPAQALVSGFIVIDAVNILGIIGDPVPIYQYTVVQHWLLTTDYNHIAVGSSLSLHPCSKIGTLTGIFFVCLVYLKTA